MTLDADVIPINKMAVSTSAGNHNAPGIPNLSAYGGGPRLIQAPRVMDGSGTAVMPAQATADLMSMMTMTAKQPFAPQQQQVWQLNAFITLVIYSFLFWPSLRSQVLVRTVEKRHYQVSFCIKVQKKLLK